MPVLVLVTSNFDDDMIKNEPASMETAFSHYKSMAIFFRAANSVVSGSGLRLCMSSLPASIKRIG